MASLITAFGMAGLLAGCSGDNLAFSPVGWWHELEGGQIAQQRPPPPGSELPFPNVGTVPPRPAAADVAAEQRIADQLAAQRDQAEASAARNPLTAIAPPPKPPPPPAPDPNGNKVVVDAAPAPPPPPKPAAPPPAAPIPRLADVPALPDAVASGPLPEFAAAPPPLATGVGDFVAAPTVPPPPPEPPARAPNGVVIAFSPGSAVLPPSAPLNLSRFALSHKGAPLAVTGHGEAVLRNPDAQSRAMDLAFKRVQAIATSLAAAGVPADHLSLHAEATGTGGSATLPY